MPLTDWLVATLMVTEQLSNYTRLTTYKAELDHTKTSAICYLRARSASTLVNYAVYAT